MDLEHETPVVTRTHRPIVWARLDAARESSSAMSVHQLPALGPPPHVPSDSPGCLIQRYASTSGWPVFVVGSTPSAWPCGLHHCVVPMPFRLVSIRKCLPPMSRDSFSP